MTLMRYTLSIYHDFRSYGEPKEVHPGVAVYECSNVLYAVKPDPDCDPRAMYTEGDIVAQLHTPHDWYMYSGGIRIKGWVVIDPRSAPEFRQWRLTPWVPGEPTERKCANVEQP